MTNSVTRTKYPLDFKKVIKKTIGQVIMYSFFTVFLGALIYLQFFLELSDVSPFTSFVNFASQYVIQAIIILIVLSSLYQYWYFNTYYYELGEDYFTIRKGPITPTEVTISYDKIQDIYVDQDILDRIFGLYDVHISTATVSSGMHAHIDGVLSQSANGLRDQILAEVKKRKTNNTV